MRLSRPRIGSIALSALVSAYLLLATNGTFWRKGFRYFGDHTLDLVAFGLALYLLLFSLLTALSVKYLFKPLCIALVLVAAAASYFVDSYGLVIDHDMIANMMLTNTAEAGHLLTGSLVLHMALFGVLPALLIAFVRIGHRPIWQKVRWNIAVILPSLAVAVVLILSFYSTFGSTLRMHRDLIATLNPVATITAGIRYVGEDADNTIVALAPLGEDARRGAMLAGSPKPVVTVLVLGETARSQNFALNGYERDTTPELARRNVVSFTSVSSCGTSTAVSVPCMFSNLTRAHYSKGAARSVENVLDVLSRAGIDIRWLDNDTGTYGVADRVPYTFLPSSADPRFCRNGECIDAILLDRLDAEMKNITRDTVIVLHQIGSHGPTYFERYPEGFERFTPACHTAEFADCTRDEIVNAYDNTILYTDHIVSSAIDTLAARHDLDTAMLFVSDHGESLGENGIYLHAMPYMLAPATQTTVPMVAWFSDGYRARAGIDTTCLSARRGEPLSHDNFFHTLIGLAGVETSVHDAAMDAFAPCRGTHPAARVSSLTDGAGR